MFSEIKKKIKMQLNLFSIWHKIFFQKLLDFVMCIEASAKCVFIFSLLKSGIPLVIVQ